MGVPPLGRGGGDEPGARKGKPRVKGEESLYTEDRPHTESVIGQRRRRDPSDSKDTKESAAGVASP
ncbi:hypothetical protein A4G27_08815 [Mycobacterium kansasii]|nr:hypothetical protein A4G27_08815 [Mycobacterium kansasii]